MEIFDILGPHSHPHPAPIEVKFCTAKQTHVPFGRAEFDVNRCNESPLRGEKPDFWSVSKFNTGSLPLCGILPVKNIFLYVPSKQKHCNGDVYVYYVRKDSNEKIPGGDANTVCWL